MQIGKLLRTFHQPALMVAGSLPGQKILRHAKAARFLYGSGVLDAKSGKKLYDFSAVGAVWIGKAAHRISGDPLQFSSVLQNLQRHLLQRTTADGGMQYRMAGNLMPPIQLLPLLCRNPVRPVLQSGIQVKSSPNAVFVHDLHQTAVFQTAIVVAQCEYLMPSSGKADVMNFAISHFSLHVRAYYATVQKRNADSRLSNGIRTPFRAISPFLYLITSDGQSPWISPGFQGNLDSPSCLMLQ